jgi:hypothetical protein
MARNERLARWVGFSWGFAEGLFFFIVPDVYVMFAMLFAPRAGVMAWIYSIGGSMAAVSVIHLVAVSWGCDYLSFLVRIPGISGGLIEQVNAKLAAGGLPYSPLLVLGGVPLKVYASLAFARGFSFGSVMLWTVFARIARMAPPVALAGLTRLVLHRSLDGHTKAWCVAFVCAWALFYVFYFIRMGWF